MENALLCQQFIVLDGGLGLASGSRPHANWGLPPAAGRTRCVSGSWVLYGGSVSTTS